MATLANTGVSNQMAFGQHGSAYIDTATALTPPLGKVIVAITFLDDNTPTGLVAEDPNTIFNTASAAHNESSATAEEGTGGLVLASQAFPKGLTIYGRWTSFTPSAAGCIVYFGPAKSPVSTS
jgi:hypothetical protein|tara:strand:- start:14 stop:382 length:369 start_codon:yes stop_codon:yes gene_type:complete